LGHSLYGATKLCSLLLIAEYGIMDGLCFVVNRCGVLAGPRQVGKVDQGVFALWVPMHRFGREHSYDGWGEQVCRCATTSTLMISANCLTPNSLASRPCPARRLTRVGVCCSLSLLEATQGYQEITGRTVAARSVPETRLAYVKWYIWDNRKVA